MPRGSKASTSGKAAAKAPAKKAAAVKGKASAAKVLPKKAAKKPSAKAGPAKAKKVAPKTAAKKSPAKPAPVKQTKTPAKKVAAKAPTKAPSSKAAPSKAASSKAAPTKAGPTKTAPARPAPPRSAARSAGGGIAAVPRPVEPPAKKAATKGHDAKFLEEMRALLLEERVDYEKQAEEFRAEAEALAADMEPGDSQFDEETGGEGDTMSIERERDLALSAQARAAVDEIDRALLKIDAGTYGICERCHQPIPKARLKALPYASLCVACKSGGLSRR